ncbi:response regulator [Cellulomonas fengjieae]|uniref:Response regulator transcription factor n=1 Tax=Cellulomonas fengjieae TaxID=2819978 RepID=A0ABS3SI91_9CELL|nr:response regulator transcription factor [Cellulomonas fengjieae]MBO3085468.1 response regulator transcription factor [Cellulomonas fengjieae]QVI64485.1 response regulator transcription factor [Cellulomonas fengjieae]
MTTVLMVDDQDLVRAGLRALLTNDPGITVVADAADGERAVELAVRHRPDVVLMDIRMPGTDGIEATRRIRADPRLAQTRVLILTTFDDDDDVIEAIRVGAAGYLLKDTPGPALRQAVHTAAAGGSLLSPAITRRLMDFVAASSPPPAPHPRLGTLSERELEVLERVGHGDTNDEIAVALFLSPATARTYVSRILTKLDARDRTELAIIAHRSGLT